MLSQEQIDHIKAAGVPGALEAALSSSDPSSDETIQCTMCFLPYYCPDADQGFETPKILPCGHVFGAKCLRLWVEGDQAMAEFCPKCRLDLRFRNCEHVMMPLPYRYSKITKVTTASELPDECVHCEYSMRIFDLVGSWRGLLKERSEYSIAVRQLLRHWPVEIFPQNGRLVIPDIPDTPEVRWVGEAEQGPGAPVIEGIHADGEVGGDHAVEFEAAEGPRIAPIRDHISEIDEAFQTYEPYFSESEDEEDEDKIDYDHNLPLDQPAEITQKTADQVNEFNERCLVFVHQARENLVLWNTELDEAETSTTEFRLDFNRMED